MFKTIFLLLFLLVAGGVVALPFLLLNDSAAVRTGSALSPADLDRAKAVLHRNNPRNLAPGEMVTQWIDEAEMTLAASYALGQLAGGGAAFQLHPGRAYSQVSVEVPDNPFGRYLNASLILVQQGSTLEIENLTLGDVSIPGWLAEPLRNYANRGLQQIPEYAAATASLNGMQILEDRMLVAYQWRPELLDSIRSRGQGMIVDDAMRERLLAYSRQINNVAAQPGMGQEVSLTAFLTPMFYLAQARGGDPVEENRAALLALAFYFGGVSIDRMLGIEIPDKQSVNKRLTLSGRYDFTQHFLTSAALTLAGTSGIADAVGLFKELDDAKGGSGFSFTDLGADRAGVRLAQYATANEANARALQNLMTGSLSEDDFMPNFLDLPELMPNEVFLAEYGGVGSARYNEVAADIETRLNSLPLYR